MVTKLLKSSGGVAAPLGYNEEKFFEGEAEAVCVRNIEDNNPYAIRKAMRRLEENPEISGKTKNYSFHMAVSPGPGEADGEDGKRRVVAYIEDLMTEIGYGRQPYVIYRHHDIDRVHYHVVSVRVRENGRVIRDCFSWPKTMAAQRALCKKYGFTVGREESQAQGAGLPVRRLEKGMANLVAQTSANVNDVLSWNIASALQMRAAMLSLGLRAVHKDNPKGRRKKKYWSFTPSMPDGKPFSWPLKGSRVVGEDFDEKFMAAVRRAKGEKGGGDAAFVAAVVAAALRECRSVTEMRNALLQAGIYLYVEAGAGKMPRSSKHIAAAALAVPSEKKTYTASEVRLNLDALRSMPLRLKDDRALPLSEEALRAVLRRHAATAQAPRPKSAAAEPRKKKKTGQKKASSTSGRR